MNILRETGLYILGIKVGPIDTQLSRIQFDPLSVNQEIKCLNKKEFATVTAIK